MTQRLTPLEYQALKPLLRRKIDLLDEPLPPFPEKVMTRDHVIGKMLHAIFALDAYAVAIARNDVQEKMAEYADRDHTLRAMGWMDLSPAERHVLGLRYWGGYSLNNVAINLHVSYATVRRHCEHALGVLAEALADDPRLSEYPAGKFSDVVSTTRRPPISFELRLAVYERDGFVCRHCGSPYLLACDHIMPFSRGGPTAFHNLQTLCRSCNSKKGASMPSSIDVAAAVKVV